MSAVVGMVIMSQWSLCEGTDLSCSRNGVFGELANVSRPWPPRFANICSRTPVGYLTVLTYFGLPAFLRDVAMTCDVLLLVGNRTPMSAGHEILVH